jgi:hypothetical protein
MYTTVDHFFSRAYGFVCKSTECFEYSTSTWIFLNKKDAYETYCTRLIFYYARAPRES